MSPGKRRKQESGAGKRVERGTLETGRGHGWDGKRVARETGGAGYGEPGKACRGVRAGNEGRGNGTEAENGGRTGNGRQEAWGFLGRPGWVLGPLGTSWGLLGPPGGLVGPPGVSWGGPGASWGLLGPPGGLLGRPGDP